MVLVICKTLRQNERVYFRFSVCPSGFFVCFILIWNHFSIYNQISLWCLKLALISNGGKKQKNEPVCSWPKVWYSVREEKDFTQFLKSPKSPSPEFSPVGWCHGKKKKKKHPFSGYKGSVAIYGFTVKCWGTVAFEQLYIFLQLVFLWEEAGKKSPTCKYLCSYIRENKKWKETRVKIYCFTG